MDYRSKIFPGFAPSIATAIVFVTFLLVPVRAADREEAKARLREAAAPLERMGDVLRSAFESAAPSIVHIESIQTRPVHPSRPQGRSLQMQVEETGSGVTAAFGEKRVILTNRHVVEDADSDSVKIRTYDRRLLTPVRIRTNAEFDLAVIEVAEAAPEPVDFGDSDAVRRGDIVLAVGSPFGLEQSVTMGIVSATDRRRIPAATARTPLCGFFQIDAAVNPGSSGGPMLNLRGEVVGLITAIATQGGGNEGVAFTMPIKNVLRIARQLVEGEYAVRPYVGLSFDPSFGFEEHRRFGLDRLVGARIDRILPDTPAAETELAADDVILFFNETEVEDDLHVFDLVARSEIGTPVLLKVLREGKIVPVPITPTALISR